MSSHTPTTTPTGVNKPAATSGGSLDALLREKVSQVVHNHLGDLRKTATTAVRAAATATQAVLKESLVLLPKVFRLKTEKLSGATCEAHERLYARYLKGFNQTSAKIDGCSPDDLATFRDLKREEQYNLNAVKLHELYFANIADPNSVLHTDSLPFMRLSRDWGTFDKWQVDFRASCLAAREGWAVCVYEPFRSVYMNVVVDGHGNGIPVGAVPVLVMDMWSHAYFRDYLDDKFSYVNNMLREVNWTVVEARMILAERSQLDIVYRCLPVVDHAPETVLNAVAPGTGPIEPKSSPSAAEMVQKGRGGLDHTRLTQSTDPPDRMHLGQVV